MSRLLPFGAILAFAAALVGGGCLDAGDPTAPPRSGPDGGGDSRPPDTTPPTAPTGLQCSPAGPNSITLTWNAAADDRGVLGYKIYRDGAHTRVASVTTATESFLSCRTTFCYAVSAVDSAGNESPLSTEVCCMTALCPAPPPPAEVWAVPRSNSEVDVLWEDTGAASYRVYFDGDSTDVAGAARTRIAALACGTDHRFEVASIAPDGVPSARSAAASCRTRSCTPAPLVLQANFDTDIPGAVPDTTLPGGPVGDSLSLAGHTWQYLVEDSTSTLGGRAVTLQNSGSNGAILTFILPAGARSCGRYTIRWLQDVVWLYNAGPGGLGVHVEADSFPRPTLAHLGIDTWGRFTAHEQDGNPIDLGDIDVGAPYQLEMIIDRGQHTWSLTINGVPVPAVTGVSTVDRTEAPLRHVRFSVGAIFGGAVTVALDDIEVEAGLCPDPAALPRWGRATGSYSGRDVAPLEE